jgi:hypothetical protein
MAEFRNPEMANEISSALEKRITGIGLRNMLWNRVKSGHIQNYPGTG